MFSANVSFSRKARSSSAIKNWTSAAASARPLVSSRPATVARSQVGDVRASWEHMEAVIEADYRSLCDERQAAAVGFKWMSGDQRPRLVDSRRVLA